MADSDSKNLVRIDLGAKAEAKFELKAEVPPSSVGRLVDAFTDIIRPFSEARGLKADLLRLQREEIAIEIARRARAKIALENAEPNPVPNKVLIPLLEKGSYEDTRDDSMIERWANLLASASITPTVQPRFISILGELAGAQAECLDRVAFNRHTEFCMPHRILSDAAVDFAPHHLADGFEGHVRSILKSEKDMEATLDRIFHIFSRPGVFLALAIINDPGSELWVDYDSVNATGIRDESNFSILESLGLVRYVVLQFSARLRRKKEFEIGAYYYHLTELGFIFVEACSRPRLLELERVDQISAEKGLQEPHPY